MLAWTLAACGGAPQSPSQPPQPSAPESGSEPPASESTVVLHPDEYETLHDRYLLYGTILGYAWDDPEELRPEFFPTYYFFYHLENVGGLLEKYPDGMIPRDDVEAMVQSHFDVSTDFLRSGDDYRPEQEAYEFYGIGSVGYTKITRAEQTGGRLTIYYDMLNPADELIAQGAVVIEVDGDGYQYLSNSLTRFDA